MSLLLPHGPYEVIQPLPADYRNADYGHAFLLILKKDSVI